MKTIRTIVIDPEAQTVTVENLDLSLENLKRLLRCESVSIVYVGEGHYMYVDDVGLYRKPDELGRLPQTWFHGASQPIVGRVLLVGTPDHEGDETSCTLHVAQVWAGIERFVLEPLPPIPPMQMHVVSRDDL